MEVIICLSYTKASEGIAFPLSCASVIRYEKSFPKKVIVTPSAQTPVCICVGPFRAQPSASPSEARFSLDQLILSSSTDP